MCVCVCVRERESGSEADATLASHHARCFAGTSVPVAVATSKARACAYERRSTSAYTLFSSADSSLPTCSSSGTANCHVSKDTVRM